MKRFPIHILHKHEYPPLLVHISDPPNTLYIRGSIPTDPNMKYICVVGSRSHTQYGKDVCNALISGLRGYNICVVSGLALGIDTCAHKAALEAGLCTIAVPGSGLDETVLYPRANNQLAIRILEAGGAILSEEHPLYRATPYSFPKRNRIMAGICHATLVIEAELKSGTLITSKYATEYNRDVCTVPGSIFSKKSDGPHMLIRLGATPIRTSIDILEVLGFDTTDTSHHTEKKREHILTLCTPDERATLSIISTTPRTRDELIRLLCTKLHKTVAEITALLMILEIRELISEKNGELYICM